MLLTLMLDYLSGQIIFVFTQLIVVDWILLIKRQALTCLLQQTSFSFSSVYVYPTVLLLITTCSEERYHLDRDLTKTAGRFGVPVTTPRGTEKKVGDGRGNVKMTSLSTHHMVWPEQWCEYPCHTEDVSSRMPGGAERSGTDHAQHFISQWNHPRMGEWRWHPNRPQDGGTDMTAWWVSSSCRTCWNRSAPCRGIPPRTDAGEKRDGPGAACWETDRAQNFVGGPSWWPGYGPTTYQRWRRLAFRHHHDRDACQVSCSMEAGELEHASWTEERGRRPSVSYVLRAKEYRQQELNLDQLNSAAATFMSTTYWWSSPGAWLSPSCSLRASSSWPFTISRPERVSW